MPASNPLLLLLLRLLSVGVLMLSTLPAHAAQSALVVSAEIRGAVSPASAAYFTRTLAEARDKQAALVVVSLDTPGGLDTAMRDMIQAIFASPVPVAIYVYPSGARAASAGTYLLYASHVAAMAPGTNLGAATPVAVGIGGRDKPAGGDRPMGKPGAEGDKEPAGKAREAPRDAMEAKAMHDAAAYLRSLAQLRGRNVEWADRAVREAVSLSADEALQNKVVDVVARDVPDLLRRLDGREVKVDVGAPRKLALAGAQVVKVEANWKERFLARLADPNIALILMMIGVYGLLFEFYSPGMAVPGVIGAICLLLGLYGMALLPINYVGIALILLGIAFMVSEMFLPSFGVLGIGGIVAFVAGALLLVDAEVPGVAISWGLIVPFAMLSGLAAAAVGYYVMRSRQRPSVAGREGMLGGSVEALENIEKEGWVRGYGERWRARSKVPLAQGAHARIVGIDGLTLIVEPSKEGEES